MVRFRRRLRRRPRRLVGPLQTQHQLDQFFLAQALEVDPSHNGMDPEIHAQRKGFPGRDAPFGAPPGQIPAGPIRALGSYLGCLTAKRTLGQG